MTTMQSYSTQLRLLGACPLLVVAADAFSGLLLAAVFALLQCSIFVLISSTRGWVPVENRYLFYAVVSASLATIAALLVHCYTQFNEPLMHTYIVLLAANALVFSGAQDIATRFGLVGSVLIGIRNAAGVAGIVLCIGMVRELLTAGSLFGRVMLMQPGLLLMRLPAGGLLLLALILALVNRSANSRKEGN
jgi:electron transport complex protein RnfE